MQSVRAKHISLSVSIFNEDLINIFGSFAFFKGLTLKILLFKSI